MTAEEIVNNTLAFLSQSSSSEEAFNEQALSLFRYQYENNLPYQTYCRAKRKTPRLVKSWTEIPAVPIDAFKEVPLSCTGIETAVATFMTSGTTTGARGKHYHSTLEVYDQSMKTVFKKKFMRNDEHIPMGILFPKRELMPNSSLAHYLALAAETFSGNDFTYFVDDRGLETNELIQELAKREAAGTPYALLGASFSFVHLFEALERQGRRFSLPKGSKLLDTGGFKNQSKELDLALFYQKMKDFLGVEPENCINMFGMTELSTQFYDDGNAVIPSEKSGPHWIRTRVVDPMTGEDQPDGEPGVLVHYDLANMNSVAAILTEDMGVKKENGFLFLGRVEGAEAKGCSLALESFIQATKGALT
ncbi:long-chain fatty acid--CoA ligase [Sporosarcina sp. HYO08]|uniref:LuxE/PaaK family acyltransferase n=1 Tax=Sporosarcina sp. HYO08 TaxID=1759557 RepID=UPI000797A52C|nr:long-chain fatty acid--CoA ligase [Sporosarcina sp. HYO08]KXH87456.1 long-chain fatty acid--CoA ligase [Sporosarcina sp. HYO08]